MEHQGWTQGFNTNIINYYNSFVSLDTNNVTNLVFADQTPDIDDILFGEFTKYISGLIYYPIDLVTDRPSGLLKCGINDVTGVTCHNLMTATQHLMGYNLGEYYYTRYYNDFRDYEPYSTLKVYLPFYGFADISIADVIGKYIQFRLRVDFPTGQALYVIGVNDNPTGVGNTKFWNPYEDINTRILSTHSFKLGVSNPFGRSNMAETIRNTAMGLVKGVATVAGTYVAPAITTGTESTKTVTTARNPSTGRQITTGTVKTTTNIERDNTNYQKSRMATTAFETSASTISNMQITPSTDIPNNSLLMDTLSLNVHLVIRRCQILDVDDNFYELFGRPLGEVMSLSTIHGYAEISEIHFEGSGFAKATNKEMAMIEQAFSDGVILP